MTYDPSVSLGALLQLGGLVVTVIVLYTGIVWKSVPISGLMSRLARIETTVEALWGHFMLRILVSLAVLLVGVLAFVLVAAAGPNYAPSVVGSPPDEPAPMPRVWTPPVYRDPAPGDNLLRSPTGDSTGRNLLAPDPIYRPMPFPDQRGRPLIRER